MKNISAKSASLVMFMFNTEKNLRLPAKIDSAGVITVVKSNIVKTTNLQDVRCKLKTNQKLIWN